MKLTLALITFFFGFVLAELTSVQLSQHNGFALTRRALVIPCPPNQRASQVPSNNGKCIPACGTGASAGPGFTDYCVCPANQGLGWDGGCYPLAAYGQPCSDFSQNSPTNGSFVTGPDATCYTGYCTITGFTSSVQTLLGTPTYTTTSFCSCPATTVDGITLVAPPNFSTKTCACPTTSPLTQAPQTYQVATTALCSTNDGLICSNAVIASPLGNGLDSTCASGTCFKSGSSNVSCSADPNNPGSFLSSCCITCSASGGFTTSSVVPVSTCVASCALGRSRGHSNNTASPTNDNCLCNAGTRDPSTFIPTLSPIPAPSCITGANGAVCPVGGVDLFCQGQFCQLNSNSTLSCGACATGTVPSIITPGKCITACANGSGLQITAFGLAGNRTESCACITPYYTFNTGTGTCSLKANGASCSILGPDFTCSSGSCISSLPTGSKVCGPTCATGLVPVQNAVAVGATPCRAPCSSGYRSINLPGGACSTSSTCPINSLVNAAQVIVTQTGLTASSPSTAGLHLAAQTTCVCNANHVPLAIGAITSGFGCVACNVKNAVAGIKDPVSTFTNAPFSSQCSGCALGYSPTGSITNGTFGCVNLSCAKSSTDLSVDIDATGACVCAPGYSKSVALPGLCIKTPVCDTTQIVNGTSMDGCSCDASMTSSLLTKPGPGLKCQCLPPNVAQVTPGAPQNTCLLPCSDANASRVSSDACTCNASFIPDIDAPIVFGFIGPVCVTSSPGMGGYCDATTLGQTSSNGNTQCGLQQCTPQAEATLTGTNPLCSVPVCLLPATFNRCNTATDKQCCGNCPSPFIPTATGSCCFSSMGIVKCLP